MFGIKRFLITAGTLLAFIDYIFDLQEVPNEKRNVNIG